METLNIEKFNPTKTELVTLAKKYKNLKIKGIDDKVGYMAVDMARKELKQVRRKIQITGREMRSEAIKFQKEVIARENEYVEMIEPIEKSLAEKQHVIDEEKERLARVALLPERKKRLAEYKIAETDENLLAMDDAEFDAYANAKISEVLEEREQQLLEKERKLAQEKQEAEDKARRENELEAARIQATKEAEERAKREREEAKAKKDHEEWEAKKEQERAEKNKKYQAWLKGNKIDESGSGDIIKRDGNTFTAYRPFARITIE